MRLVASLACGLAGWAGLSGLGLAGLGYAGCPGLGKAGLGAVGLGVAAAWVGAGCPEWFPTGVAELNEGDITIYLSFHSEASFRMQTLD